VRPVSEPGQAAGQIVTSVRFTSVIVRGDAGAPATIARDVAVAADPDGAAAWEAASASPAASRPAPASDISMTVRRNRVTPPRLRVRLARGRAGSHERLPRKRAARPGDLPGGLRLDGPSRTLV
jgi:hypothetical protein